LVRSNTLLDRITDYSLIVALSLIALLSLFPIWHTLALSFSEQAAVNAGMVSVWPSGFNVSSYLILMEDEKFFRSFLVSVKRSVLGGVINFVLTVLMAYPLSKVAYQFPGRNVYMWYMVISMLFSGGLIPLYMTVSEMGLLNNIWSLVLPSAVPVFSVILIMNFFRGLPKELDEAAVVDGAGPWYTLLYIYLPLSLPGLATVTLFSIVGHWNSFFDGLIFMNKPENYPLQTYIQQMVIKVTPELVENLTSDQLIELMKTSDKTLNAAKLIIAMAPLLVIYPFLQKYFVNGIVLGSVKE